MIIKYFITLTILLLSSVASAAEWSVVEVRGAELTNPDTTRFSVAYGDVYIALARVNVTVENKEALLVELTSGEMTRSPYAAQSIALTKPTYREKLGLLTSIENILKAPSGKVSADALARLYEDPEGALNELAHIRAAIIAISP